jgi:Co/Zn/Cd efflux system component
LVGNVPISLGHFLTGFSFWRWASASSYNHLNALFLYSVSLGGCPLAAQITNRCLNFLGVENPKVVLIVGCIGLVLNIISAAFLHGKKTIVTLSESQAYTEKNTLRMSKR